MTLPYNSTASDIKEDLRLQTLASSFTYLFQLALLNWILPIEILGS